MVKKEKEVYVFYKNWILKGMMKYSNFGNN